MSYMRSPKVFVVGFHKTGLTSMGAALKLLGYTVCHRAGPLRKSMGHEAMIAALRAKNYDPVWNLAEHFDAFHDNPWFWLYKELDTLFPGSKFILTTRNETDWLRSAQNYFGHRQSDFLELIYGHASIAGNEALFAERFRQHNEEVRRHFANRREDLLEIDVTTHSHPWSPICAFLGASIPTVDFPVLNARSKKGLFNQISQVLKRKKPW